ncbi:MAG: stearoyl-CoA 9-desaturase [Acidimicrobiia bacterium]|nr:stearoyl-CoA 9-desaturase [Acidimicrobiia bacterium]
MLTQLDTGLPIAPDAAVTSPPEVPAIPRWQQLVTGVIVFSPVAAVVYGASRWLSHGITAHDIVLFLLMYMVIGFGVTVGYHRFFTHRSFAAPRPLKIALAIAGSMAFEGGPIGWVNGHRRHHAFSDTERDPHSPLRFGPTTRSKLGAMAHAHMGWLFKGTPPGCDYAKDLRADRDLVVIDQLFPLWCILSLAAPFFLGWWWAGHVSAGLTALLWAGGVRVFLLHHATWSINSLCHVTGRRPFPTKDNSTNIAALAVVTFGESWHNAHHAFPRSARHGMLPHQWDPAARVIRIFEQLGWATAVRWPSRTPRAYDAGTTEDPPSVLETQCG